MPKLDLREGWYPTIKGFYGSLGALGWAALGGSVLAVASYAAARSGHSYIPDEWLVGLLILGLLVFPLLAYHKLRMSARADALRLEEDLAASRNEKAGLSVKVRDLEQALAAEKTKKSTIEQTISEALAALNELSIDLDDGVPIDGRAIFAAYGSLLDSNIIGEDWIHKTCACVAVDRRLPDDYHVRTISKLEEILRLLELHRLVETPDSTNVLPNRRRYALTARGRSARKYAQDSWQDDTICDLRAMAVEGASSHSTTMLDVMERLGGRAHKWSTTQALADTLCPRLSDGTVAARWLTDGNGKALNIVTACCEAMRQRGFMTARVDPVTVTDAGSIFDAPCSEYKWNDSGSALYRCAVNKSAQQRP